MFVGVDGPCSEGRFRSDLRQRHKMTTWGSSSPAAPAHKMVRKVVNFSYGLLCEMVISRQSDTNLSGKYVRGEWWTARLFDASFSSGGSGGLDTDQAVLTLTLQTVKQHFILCSSWFLSDFVQRLTQFICICSGTRSSSVLTPFQTKGKSCWRCQTPTGTSPRPVLDTVWWPLLLFAVHPDLDEF